MIASSDFTRGPNSPFFSLSYSRSFPLSPERMSGCALETRGHRYSLRLVALCSCGTSKEVMVTAASSGIGLDVAKKLIVKGMAWFRTSGISHNIQAIRAVLWGKGKGVNSGENWGMARLSSALGAVKAHKGKDPNFALKHDGIQPLVAK